MKFVKLCVALVVVGLSPIMAQAISSEGAELSSSFIGPFDKPDASTALSALDGVSVRFKATALPAGGAAAHTYDWGLSLGSTGLKTSCTPQGVFAAFRSNGLGQRQFVVRGVSNTSSCEDKLVVHDFQWNENQWYELTVARDNYVTERLSYWHVSVKNLDNPSASQTLTTGVYAKNSLSSANVISRLRGSQCSDSDWRVEWSKPSGVLNSQAYRISRVNYFLGEGACGKSVQNLISTCGLHWTHQMGGSAAKPVGSYAYGDRVKEPATCREIASGLGVEVAKSYISAITGEGSRSVGVSPVNFHNFGCNHATVWKDACQSMAYNGHGGKTFMMNAITPVSDRSQWEQSNIKNIIPENLMHRVMTDPEFTKAKSLFGYMSNPSNNWYPWLAGQGQAKEVLRAYMDTFKK